MKKNIDIVNSFKDDFVCLFHPVSVADINQLENIIKAKLPNDFVDFLKFSNGIIIDGDEVLGINNKVYDLIKAYDIEHNKVRNPMYSYIVPFSPDGRGNFYCFDLRSDNIIFWTSNYDYNNVDQPEVVNKSFTDWFKEVMIDWSIENNGNDIFRVLPSNKSMD